MFINCLQLIIFKRSRQLFQTQKEGRAGKFTLISKAFLFTWALREGPRRASEASQRLGAVLSGEESPKEELELQREHPDPS